jgi:hypothetical protein
VTLGGFDPEPAQQAGDDQVLLGLGTAGQGYAGHAPLKEQGDRAIEGVRGVKPRGHGISRQPVPR